MHTVTFLSVCLNRFRMGALRVVFPLVQISAPQLLFELLFSMFEWQLVKRHWLFWGAEPRQSLSPIAGNKSPCKRCSVILSFTDISLLLVTRRYSGGWRYFGYYRACVTFLQFAVMLIVCICACGLRAWFIFCSVWPSPKAQGGKKIETILSNRLRQKRTFSLKVKTVQM